MSFEKAYFSLEYVRLMMHENLHLFWYRKSIGNNSTYMKFLRRFGLGVIIIILTIFLLRGWVYRSLITYHKVGERVNYEASDSELLDYIDSKTTTQNLDVKSIIKISLAMTSKSLVFTSGANDKDPNKLISTKRANCIGYASYFSTVCNQLLVKNNLSDQWIAKPLIGQLYLFNRSIHPYFNSAFFKDHDFAVIENKTSGQVFAVDPSLADYTGIDFIRIHPSSPQSK